MVTRGRAVTPYFWESVTGTRPETTVVSTVTITRLGNKVSGTMTVNHIGLVDLSILTVSVGCRVGTGQ